MLGARFGAADCQTRLLIPGYKPFISENLADTYLRFQALRKESFWSVQLEAGAVVLSTMKRLAQLAVRLVARLSRRGRLIKRPLFLSPLHPYIPTCAFPSTHQLVRGCMESFRSLSLPAWPTQVHVVVFTCPFMLTNAPAVIIPRASPCCCKTIVHSSYRP